MELAYYRNEKENVENKLEFSISDIEEAKEVIREALERGEYPIISVPVQYVDAVKKGIKPHSTWIGEKIIAGTILREPYSPSNEERVFFRIKTTPDKVLPRFTGPDKKFYGVVVFKGPIEPDQIEPV